MFNEKEYYAFISYSHKDEEWAKWLQHEFEHYHLPTTLNGLNNLPDKFRPIFRDIDELSGGELKPQISHALKSSAYLVIICSPNSAKSAYVSDEIKEFIEIGKEIGVDNVRHIFPFIIDGIPHSKDNLKEECFPLALRELPTELIAGDVTKHGREHAFVKILSGTLHKSGVGFSMLWNQFERDRIEAERKEREKRDRLLLLESRYLSEKALDIVQEDSGLAKMLILRALPKDLSDSNDRPYCVEAESALRKICHFKSRVLNLQEEVFAKLSPNHNKVVSYSNDGFVKIFDVETGEQTNKFPFKDTIHNVALSYDEKTLATYANDGTIKLWDIQMDAPILYHTLRSSYEEAKKILVTRDNKKLIVLSFEMLEVWDITNETLLFTIQGDHYNGITVDKKDRWLAVACCGPFSVKIFDMKDGDIIQEISNAHSESLISLDFSPDGTKIVSTAFDGKFKVWNWQTGELELSKIAGIKYGAYAPNVYSAKYSNDGKFIVTTSHDNIIRIWNAASGELQGKPFADNTNTIDYAGFNDDGSSVILTSLNRTIRILDIKHKAPYKIFGRARYIPFDSHDIFNNYQLQIDGCEVKITNSQNGDVVYVLTGHTRLVKEARFSFDGSKIVTVSCDGCAKIWDAHTGKQIGLDLIGHLEYPHTAAFSPDGLLLITASKTELKIWDVNSNIQLGPDITFWDPFYKVEFSQDGRNIITETENDYDLLIEWEPLQELINKTREQIASRHFTELEKKKYYIE